LILFQNGYPEAGLKSLRKDFGLFERRTTMPSRFVLGLTVIAMVLALAAFASSSAASNGQPGPASDPAIHTVLQPDLTLHSTLSRSFLPQGTNDPGMTTSGFCVDSCGSIRCTTNADCGPGGECRPFVICNDKTGKIEGNESVGLYSHRGEMPGLNVKCT
jgi:hypothetical protein